MPRPIRYHYVRPGRGETVFHETLVLARTDLKVTLLEPYEGAPVRAGTSTILEAGAPIVWFVFPGAWHDVGRFHLADGTFTGWYTNLSTPVAVEGDRWRSTDLFLDLWQPADGSGHRWLDTEEFERAVASGVVGPDLARRTLEERDAVNAQLALNQWPPAVTREIDLATAKQLAATE